MLSRSLGLSKRTSAWHTDPQTRPPCPRPSLPPQDPTAWTAAVGRSGVSKRVLTQLGPGRRKPGVTVLRPMARQGVGRVHEGRLSLPEPAHRPAGSTTYRASRRPAPSRVQSSGSPLWPAGEQWANRKCRGGLPPSVSQPAFLGISEDPSSWWPCTVSEAFRRERKSRERQEWLPKAGRGKRVLRRVCTLGLEPQSSSPGNFFANILFWKYQTTRKLKEWYNEYPYPPLGSMMNICVCLSLHTYLMTLFESYKPQNTSFQIFNRHILIIQYFPS